MQPDNASISPAIPSPPADWPQIDLAAGGADDETIECALAQVEHRLEAWSEALEARAVQLAEAQERLGQQERSLEQARHSSTESRQHLETDEQQTNERNEARLRELDEREAALDERQAELDARLVELDQRQQQLDAREARLAGQEAELADSIQAFQERQAAAEAPTAEPADTEPASESGIEPEAQAAQKDRVLLPRSDGAQTAAQDASEDKPVVAVPAAVLPDQPEPAQPPGSVGPPVMEPRPRAAVDAPGLSDDPREAGPPVADEPPAADDIPSVDLDPETARKLRVLRRLAGPGKSDAELLAQLAAREPSKDPQEKSSKRWWKRGR